MKVKNQEIDKEMKRTYERIKSVINCKIKILKNVYSQKHKDRQDTEKEIYFINKKNEEKFDKEMKKSTKPMERQIMN